MTDNYGKLVSTCTYYTLLYVIIFHCQTLL